MRAAMRKVNSITASASADADGCLKSDRRFCCFFVYCSTIHALWLLREKTAKEEPPGSAPQEGSAATGLLRAGAEKGSAMEEPENTKSCPPSAGPEHLLWEEVAGTNYNSQPTSP
ncbi:uncharacterized protein ACIBXB_020785 isoform 2-T3 [Morphnus guianensis]